MQFEGGLIFYEDMFTPQQQIDGLVYELYGLTEGEVRVVEGIEWCPDWGGVEECWVDGDKVARGVGVRQVRSKPGDNRPPPNSTRCIINIRKHYLGRQNEEQ